MTQKFILKEGEHEFMPGSPNRWNNKTLDDTGAIAMIKMNPDNLSKFESYPADKSGAPILDGEEQAFEATVTEKEAAGEHTEGE